MTDLVVLTLNTSHTRGRIVFTHFKSEGDGRTPIGRWRIEQVLWRRDRQMRPGALMRFLPKRELRVNDGWCDTPSDPSYNRHVRHPYGTGAERLWRSDHLYDLILVTSHNQRPRIKGAGSAIFVHIARGERDGGLAPTEGCVALKRRDFAVVISFMRPGTCIRING
jgi:L,D-peptidoglycan transpeptidase YkuD (ErfK/YbiS/YcfS/YnhG family)